jgi:hypothetical protein
MGLTSGVRNRKQSWHGGFRSQALSNDYRLSKKEGVGGSSRSGQP